MKLFHRLLLTYISIVVVVLIILGVVLSQSLATFIYSQQQQKLSQLGQSIIQQATAFMAGEIPRSTINQTISTVDQSINARVWLLNQEGLIVIDSRSRAMHGRSSSYIPSQYLQPLLEGEEIARIITLMELNTKMLLVGIPITSDSGVSGALLLMTPVSDVQAALSSIYRLFWPAAGLSLMVAAVLALAVSRSISQPLRKLSEATAALAEGDFSLKVHPTGDVELRALAESLNKMASQLGELEELRRDFIASVSHELRSPLTSIRGFVQGVLDGKIPHEKQGEYLQRVLNEIRRLSSLVTNLLDLSALEGKAAPLDLKETDIREVINLSLASMEPQINGHQMSVEVVAPDYPVQAVIDQNRMQQVIVNIISNSIKHTSPGICLHVSISPKQGGVELRLADTGPGISAQQLPHIFKPFYRGQEGGTGLGLSIAKALVEAHGGTIRTGNVPGGGSEFVILIPRHNPK